MFRYGTLGGAEAKARNKTGESPRAARFTGNEAANSVAPASSLKQVFGYTQFLFCPRRAIHSSIQNYNIQPPLVRVPGS